MGWSAFDSRELPCPSILRPSKHFLSFNDPLFVVCNYANKCLLPSKPCDWILAAKVGGVVGQVTSLSNYN